MSPPSQGPIEAAPWRSTFLSHLSKMSSPEFVLSTLHPVPANGATPASTPYVPRARYCVFRGMWAELPENKHNKATMNPRVFESELPTCTTDVRMQKVEDVFGTRSFRAPPPGHAVGEPYDERLKLGEGVDDLEDEVARRNFRVVVIRPSEVEQLDLSDPKTARRYTFTYDDGTGKWNSEERWP